jgi:1,4-dihydroxy-6-naphthoate synthase
MDIMHFDESQRIELKKTITVAHSPDADDIFMYYAIKFGWISTLDMEFENIALDIESLNQDALKSIYDVSAISFALYPHIKDEYALLKCAVSFGQDYGPKLIKKKGKRLKENFKVALSGEMTTNAMIFRIAYPKARVVYKNFLDIEKAVISGEVDAGVLIHESILTYDSSLEVEQEIWDIWGDLSGGGLPLPLGGMAIRRSLPITRAIECEKILTKAVRVAFNNKELLSKMLIQRELIRVDKDRLKEYLDLYANKDSISLNKIQMKAIDKLFDLGYEYGFYSDKIECEDFFTPLEYQDYRFA